MRECHYYRLERFHSHYAYPLAVLGKAHNDRLEHARTHAKLFPDEMTHENHTDLALGLQNDAESMNECIEE